MMWIKNASPQMRGAAQRLLLSSSRMLQSRSSAGFGTCWLQRLPRYRGAGPSTSLDERVGECLPLLSKFYHKNHSISVCCCFAPVYFRGDLYQLYQQACPASSGQSPGQSRKMNKGLPALVVSWFHPVSLKIAPAGRIGRDIINETKTKTVKKGLTGGIQRTLVI